MSLPNDYLYQKPSTDQGSAVTVREITPDNNYAWWVGQDGNTWANIDGNVQQVQIRADNYGDKAAVVPGTRTPFTLYAANQIGDPNPGNTEQAANTTGTTYNTTSGADTATARRMIGIYDRQIEDLNNSLNSLDSQLQNALAGVKGEYDTYKNELRSSYDQAKSDYDTSTLQNQQNLQINKNQISSDAASGLRSLLRIIGAMGAGGSSVAKYDAPAMVTDQANREFSNAEKVFAQNQQGLDKDWNNYINGFDNDRKKLDDWYDTQVKAKKQENYEKGQSLLSDIVSAYGNRSIYGGSYGDNINSAYDRIADFRNKINELGQYTPTKYTGVTAVYDAPDLATYNAKNTNLSASINDSSDTQSPLLTALRGLTKRKTDNLFNNTEE